MIVFIYLPLFFLVFFFDFPFPPRFNVCCSIFFRFAGVFLTCRFVSGLNIFSAFGSIAFSGTNVFSTELSTIINFWRFFIVLFFLGIGDDIAIGISSVASVAGINSSTSSFWSSSWSGSCSCSCSSFCAFLVCLD